MVPHRRLGLVQPPDAAGMKAAEQWTRSGKRWRDEVWWQKGLKHDAHGVLQHVEFEGPAALADWAAGRGFSFRLFHLLRDTTLPSLSEFDTLTVMGRPDECE
jgi:hypothetical protein